MPKLISVNETSLSSPDLQAVWNQRSRAFWEIAPASINPEIRIHIRDILSIIQRQHVQSIKFQFDPAMLILGLFLGLQALWARTFQEMGDSLVVEHP